MERQRPTRQPAAALPNSARVHRPTQSFSSSLLDAICRSIDEVPAAPPSAAAGDFEGSSCRHRPLTASPCYARKPRAAAVEEKPRRPPRGLRNDQRFDCGVQRRRPPDRLAAGASGRINPNPSSDFSCSVRRTNREPERPKSRAKTPPPPSPGARLASFFGSLFPGGSPRPPRPQTAGGGRRGAERGGREREAASVSATAAKEARRRAEEAVAARRRTAAVAAVEEDAASDDSSDLFELADLTVGRGELPVYGSTNGKDAGRIRCITQPLRSVNL